MSTTLTIGTAVDGAAARFALTTGEADWCARLPTARGRRDFRAGRLAAKRAASERMERYPERLIEVCSGADGAPALLRLDARGRPVPVEGSLTISQRDGRAAAVVAPVGVRVGVDLQRRGSVPTPAIRDFLTDFEQELVTMVDPTLLWSLKKAACKALGLGRSLPLTSLELQLDDEGRLLGVRVHGTFVPTHSHLNHPWPGFHMAAVWMAGAVS